MAIIRDEFVNESGGFIGVTTIDARGERRRVPVPPGQSVWLSEEEQIETANAPRSDADNPLANGALRLATVAAEVKNRRPLRPPTPPEDEEAGDDDTLPPAAQETGATPQAASEPEEGAFADGEEVATPEAATADKPPRRRRAPAATG